MSGILFVFMTNLRSATTNIGAMCTLAYPTKSKKWMGNQYGSRMISTGNGKCLGQGYCPVKARRIFVSILAFQMPVVTAILLSCLQSMNSWQRRGVVLCFGIIAAGVEQLSEQMGWFAHSSEWRHFLLFLAMSYLFGLSGNFIDGSFVYQKKPLRCKSNYEPLWELVNDLESKTLVSFPDNSARFR